MSARRAGERGVEPNRPPLHPPSYVVWIAVAYMPVSPPGGGSGAEGPGRGRGAAAGALGSRRRAASEPGSEEEEEELSLAAASGGGVDTTSMNMEWLEDEGDALDNARRGGGAP